MSENNEIYEITQKINNKQVLQNDFNEAFQMVSSLFQKKYINKLQNVIQTHQLNAQKNPTREIKLMYALKEFMDNNKQKDADKIINMMVSLNAFKNIQNELRKFPNASNISNVSIQSANVIKQSNEIKDSSIQEDGIYDIDKSCIASKQNKITNKMPDINNLLFLLLFLNIF